LNGLILRVNLLNGNAILGVRMVCPYFKCRTIFYVRLIKNTRIRLNDTPSVSSICNSKSVQVWLWNGHTA